MTTVPAPSRLFPTRQELREMMGRPSVLITAMICGVVSLGMVLFTLYGLIMADKSINALTGAVGLLVTGFLGAIAKLLADIKRQNGGNGNGTSSGS